MKKLSLGWLVLLLALLLTGCGEKTPTTNLDVIMTDFAYNPNSFLVPAGKEITINLQNNGAVAHEFVIMKYGTDVGADFGEDDKENIYWQIQLVSGDHQTTTFTAPSDPGEYQIVCGIPGHFMAGMVGKLTVAAP